MLLTHGILSVAFVALLGCCFAQPCPKECVCRSTLVKCPAAVDFPQSFPANTEKIVLDELTVVELPPKAFAKLPNLTSIHFSRCNFGQISTCAFPKRHSKLKTVAFDLTVIGEIKEGAFRNLGVTSVAFSSSRITTVKGYAFWNIDTDFKLTFVKTTVHEIQPFAFYNVNSKQNMKVSGGNFKHIMNSAFSDTVFKSVVLQNVTFENLECNALTGLEKVQTIQISHSEFLCNCDIEWMKGATKSSFLTSIIESGTCKAPLTGAVMKDVLQNNEIKNCPEDNKAHDGCQALPQEIPEFLCPGRIEMNPSGSQSPGSHKTPPGGGCDNTRFCSWTMVGVIAIFTLNFR